MNFLSLNNLYLFEHLSIRVQKMIRMGQILFFGLS